MIYHLIWKSGALKYLTTLPLGTSLICGGAMAKKLDTYQMWEKTGVLKSKLDYIKAASATFYTQKEMSRLRYN